MCAHLGPRGSRPLAPRHRRAATTRIGAHRAPEELFGSSVLVVVVLQNLDNLGVGGSPRRARGRGARPPTRRSGLRKPLGREPRGFKSLPSVRFGSRRAFARRRGRWIFRSPRRLQSSRKRRRPQAPRHRPSDWTLALVKTRRNRSSGGNGTHEGGLSRAAAAALPEEVRRAVVECTIRARSPLQIRPARGRRAPTPLHQELLLRLWPREFSRISDRLPRWFAGSLF